MKRVGNLYSKICDMENLHIRMHEKGKDGIRKSKWLMKTLKNIWGNFKKCC